MTILKFHSEASECEGFNLQIHSKSMLFLNPDCFPKKFLKPSLSLTLHEDSTE